MPTSIEIVPWGTLPKRHWDSLLLGNGASVSLHPPFGYRSLLDVAYKRGTLTSAHPVFQSLETVDFEHVLLACWHAYLVNNALQNPSPKIAATYAQVRDALIDAVQAVHCSHAQLALPGVFGTLATFCKAFGTIVTLNYDLTLYWMMLESKGILGNWFKDAFLASHTFEYSWEPLREPYNAAGATMVFYGHGSLMLARDANGMEVKLVASNDLLVDITAKWTAGSHSPLFVSEGTSPAKLSAIRRSGYLSTVYDEVLCNMGEAVVIYGLGFNSNDQHIIDAVVTSRPKIVAISVYTGQPLEAQRQFCHQVLAALSKLSGSQVVFFDAASPGCWNNP